MADLNRQGDLQVQIADPTTQDIAGVTTDNRLKVDVLMTGNDTHPYKGMFFSYHLKDNGNYDLNIDGSSTPVDFYRGPASGKIWYVSRLLLMMEDTSMDHTKFGGIPGGITNGLDFKVTEDGVERSLVQHSIKENAEFHHICYDVQITSAVTDVLTVRWTFAKSGTWIRLTGSQSDNIYQLFRMI